MVCGAALNVVEQLEERWHKAEQGHGQNLDIQKERYQLLSFAACLVQFFAMSNNEHDRKCLHIRMFANKLVGFAAFQIGGSNSDALPFPMSLLRRSEKKHDNPFYHLLDIELKALVVQQHNLWAGMHLEDSVLHGRILNMLSEICRGWPVENRFVSRIANFAQALMALGAPPLSH